MSKSEDIYTLFRRFGGDASTYQEIVSIDQAHAAEQHWPLLGQLRPLAGADAPAAKRASVVGERVEQVEVVIYKTVPQIVHVVPDPPPAPVPAPAPVSAPVAVDVHPVVVPAPVPVAVEVVPVVDVPVVAAPVSDLKSVFERMLPQTPDEAQPQVASPLKRLIKW